MVEAVRDAAGSASSGGDKSEGGAIRSLIDVIKNEEVNVCVNLGEAVKVRLPLRPWVRFVVTHVFHLTLPENHLGGLA